MAKQLAGFSVITYNIITCQQKKFQVKLGKSGPSSPVLFL